MSGRMVAGSLSSGPTLQVLRTRQSPDGCEGGSYSPWWIWRKKPSSR
ncbi:YfjS/YafY family lipoprotein [Escherichia coli]